MSNTPFRRSDTFSFKERVIFQSEGVLQSSFNAPFCDSQVARALEKSETGIFSWKFTNSWGAGGKGRRVRFPEMKMISGLRIVKNPPRRPPCPEGCSRMCNHYLGFPHLYAKNCSFSIWNSHIAGRCFIWHPTADLQRGALSSLRGICGKRPPCSLGSFERWPSLLLSLPTPTPTLAWKGLKAAASREGGSASSSPSAGRFPPPLLRRFGLGLKGNLGLLPLRSLLKVTQSKQPPLKE